MSYLLLSLSSVAMVLLVSPSFSSPPTPGTALSPEVLNFFQSSRILVQAAPSVERATRPVVAGRFPSDPVPVFSPAAFIASANPVFFRDFDSLK